MMKINPYTINNPNVSQNQSNNYTRNSNEGIIKAIGIKPSASENLNALKTVYGEKDLKRIGIIECETCANRTYVDGSNDPGVSFKTPGRISPEASAATVMGHEMEHVSNEQADAKAEGREVVSQSVSLSTAICAECGKTYVSGGVTQTVTKGKSEYGISDELLKGAKVDEEI